MDSGRWETQCKIWKRVHDQNKMIHTSNKYSTREKYWHHMKVNETCSRYVKYIGTLFLSMLKCIIIPLVRLLSTISSIQKRWFGKWSRYKSNSAGDPFPHICHWVHGSLTFWQGEWCQWVIWRCHNTWLLLLGWGPGHCVLPGDHSVCGHPWNHPRGVHQVDQNHQHHQVDQHLQRHQVDQNH